MADYVHAHGSPDFIRSFDFIAGLHPTATGAIKADLFRLLVLSRDGGVWADADHLARNPIMKILKPDDQYICGVGRKFGMVIVGFEIIISAPGHPFITAAMDNISASKVYEKRLSLKIYTPLSENYTGPIPFRLAVGALAPSPHPRVAGIHKLANHPNFTYTIILEDNLDGLRAPSAFLAENMHALHLNAHHTMGLVHYTKAYLLWNRRDKALNLIRRVADLIAHPREIPGSAVRNIKKAAAIFKRAASKLRAL